MKKFPLLIIFVLLISAFSFECRKEVTKNSDTPKLVKPDTIPPGHAKIVAEVVSVEPVDKNNTGLCAKAPCVAVVKLESIEYGSAFPVLSVGKDVRVKFNFTLAPTSKEMFPDMDESYPGLKVGDKFEALIEHTIKMEGDKQPEFEISGYSKKLI